MIDEDLALFLDTNFGFAEVGILNNQYQINLIFDIENAPILEAENIRKTATILSSDISLYDIGHDGVVNIRGTDYEIKGITPLSDGNFSDLELLELDNND